MSVYICFILLFLDKKPFELKMISQV